MALLQADTSPAGLERPAYEPLEPGIYDFEITNDLTPKPSKNPAADGKVYDNIALELKELETGKVVKAWLSLHPKMAWMKNQFVAAVGVPVVDGNVELDDFKGRVVRAVVKQETYAPDASKPNEKKLRNIISEYVKVS